ncbi:PREDICTED: uncharacterized protein LOC109355919 isoform X2 [Lupinus angustifolius]|uniref:uncharacterized protein LOC109355919 isoform X2 n=1 Tax=Lupinus angustifolius TaxID=3871 RepID=UPI00092E5687|nr:PREDICTED: uncharacterized protein LOC109355919 isoform X2 [Lupinus angustifolius]
MKAKSGRMPLRDISKINNINNNVIDSNNKKKKNTNNQTTTLDVEDYSVDRLLLVHSDLSTILHQIDELVVEAVKLKNVNKDGRKEIESFSDVLSNMLSSLKPWVPRFQKALSSTRLVQPEILPHQALESKSVSSDDIDESDVCDSPAETTLVSPSPLVSWRANCTIQRGRQMFMLTPLPMSKALSTRHQQPSKSEFNKLASIGTSSFIALDMTDLLDNVAMKQTPKKPVPSIAIEESNNNEELGLISSPLIPRRDSSMIVMMTPCLKMSPPKSCVLLEPISEMGHVGNEKVCNRKSTPFPVGIHYSDSEDSESPGSGHASQGLAFKYPELLGIHNVPKSGIAKKTVEASPDWLMSPPKTCVLLEPPDEESLNSEKVDNISCVQITSSIGMQQISKMKDDFSKEHNQTNKSCNFGANLSHVEGTPMWQEPESSFRTGKRPGENTLKKELWTKFEAASTYIVQPKLPTIGENIQKGFLDLLEEASADE